MGSWVDGQMQGQGTLTEACGSYYQGEMRFNERNGHGKYEFLKGSYEGQWLDGKRHGLGIMYDPNGSINFDGLWEMDSMSNGSGFFGEEFKYIGQFKFGKF